MEPFGTIAAIKTTLDDFPTTLFKVGGISLLERQIRILQNNGIKKIMIVARNRAIINEEINKLKKIKANIEIIVPEKNHVNLSSDKEEETIFLNGSMLIDDRIIGKLIKIQGQGICLLSDEYAGCARVHSKNIEKINFADNKAILSSMQEMISSDPKSKLDLSLENTYVAGMRRDLPFILFEVSNQKDAYEGKNLLLDSAQNHVLDWPAWYIHRPIEKWITSYTCEWNITPNQITIINSVIAFIAVYLFGIGQIGTALVLALMVGVIDGLDGKLARVKLLTSKIGGFLDHILDKVYENGWYIAMAYYLSIERGSIVAWFPLFLILITNFSDMIVSSRFKNKFNVPFDDAGKFERRFRIFCGRRNIYMWTLIPFIIMDEFYLGFWFISTYALFSLIIRLYRFRVHTLNQTI